MDKDSAPARVGRLVWGAGQWLSARVGPLGGVGPVDVARVLVGTGLARPVRPDVVARAGLALLHDGATAAAAFDIGAARFGSAPALVDERGSLDFSELSSRTQALAAALAGRGVGPHDRVALLCRNHGGLVEAMAALSGLGSDVLFMNTSWAGPQLAHVLAAEGATGIVYDEEFCDPVASALEGDLPRFVAWHSTQTTGTTLDDLIARGAQRGFRLAPRPSTRYVVLTSGTTGAPRGAARGVSRELDAVIGLLARIPFRLRDVTLIASPLFHAWGLATLGIGIGLSATLVLQRRFDPESVLAAIERHRVRVLVVVPVMLQRILELPIEARRGYDTSSLEVVASSGSALRGDLALRFMDAFGDIVYNVYGSTEAAWASIATPGDLRAAPGTAGLPPIGTEVRIVDELGVPVERGRSGRILVRNRMLLDRYTSGDHFPVMDGRAATGDLGHLDRLGRLFVDGREDDMIVSGGENVYPQEVEDLLAGHPAIVEAAVVGVPDPEFGQRLRALVVRRPGRELSAAEVRAFVRERLARFKVPRDVEFVDALPRNETGKVIHRLPPATRTPPSSRARSPRRPPTTRRPGKTP